MYKARLVSQGFNHHVLETFSPAGSNTSLRTLLAVCAHHNLNIHQLEIEESYLYGDIGEELYLRVENRIVRLNKSLNGLKTVGKIWNNTLCSHLAALGLKE